MENIIEVKNLTKTFKTGFKSEPATVLKNVTVAFEKGKIHGVIGKNGSGKSMLFKSICGFVLPTSGEIIVEGKRIGKDIDFPKSLGVIIETPGFIPSYSGLKNLQLLASLRGKITKTDIIKTLEKVSLDPKMKKAVRKYSLGMRQRLGLAQAIMEDPSVLILDEPMNGLDKDGVKDMRNILKLLREEGKTILIASHYAEDIEELADEVYEMDGGVLTKLIK
jgi:ABC-2 type transport system ATP-binding protein